MKGPEHYAEAERLAFEATACPDEREAYCIGLAQVHATLALVAAQAEAVASRGPGDISREWDVIWGTTP